ncbi:MAG: inorganic pyrophosphatase [Mycoplasmataceae bacterium RC_NB112A]|nr:MAG: inorganic pyrophosphatase [Mycoplasmataceae bacterium RC_NB112A]KLL01885.1 MAG: inorganic pyrophosphatase [Mycoplasmataceae bacterium RC_NB112A]
MKMFVEIPKGSINKYEYNLQTQQWELDRVLSGSMHYPEEYGSFPETLDYDGDPLDVICLTFHPVDFPCSVPVRIIGVLKMIDGDEEDDKILAVNAVEPRLNNIKSLAEVSQEKLAEIENFFLRYKELEKKKVVIQGWEDQTEAKNILQKCQKLYQKYREKINQGIDKKELVKLLENEKRTKT